MKHEISDNPARVAPPGELSTDPQPRVITQWQIEERAAEILSDHEQLDEIFVDKIDAMRDSMSKIAKWIGCSETKDLSWLDAQIAVIHAQVIGRIIYAEALYEAGEQLREEAE